MFSLEIKHIFSEPSLDFPSCVIDQYFEISCGSTNCLGKYCHHFYGYVRALLHCGSNTKWAASLEDGLRFSYKTEHILIIWSSNHAFLGQVFMNYLLVWGKSPVSLERNRPKKKMNKNLGVGLQRKKISINQTKCQASFKFVLLNLIL